MIYTALTKKALRISFYAHRDQLDKSGMPYVYHPFHLAEQMSDENTTCAALLHDVAEDTEITLDDLKKEGFPDAVMKALALMTHSDDVPYLDYIRALKDDPIARKVKMADLAHNSDLSRLDAVDEKAVERVNKYKQAMLILDRAERQSRIKKSKGKTDRLLRSDRSRRVPILPFLRQSVDRGGRSNVCFGFGADASLLRPLRFLTEAARTLRLMYSTHPNAKPYRPCALASL